MKKKYEYTVGNFVTTSRESARMVQRSFRSDFAKELGVTEVPRIIQKITIERAIR